MPVSETSDSPTKGRKSRLSGVIEILYSEHRYIHTLLDKLEQQALKLKPGKVPDYHLLLESVDYLAHYPDRYHHPREDILFSMLKHDEAMAEHVDRLRQEHVAVHIQNNRLFAELNAIVDGAPVDRPALLRNLQRYIKHYRQHMSYESREIFPRARGSLRPDQLEKLKEKTRFIDDPLFGDSISHRYHRLGRDLNLRITALQDDVLEREFSALQTTLENLTKLSQVLPRYRGAPDILRRTAARPSWQSRVMNSFTRTLMKPVMRFGSLESLRAITAKADELGEGKLPEDIRSVPVSRNDYQGEWIRIAGQRCRKVILYFPGGGFIIRTAIQHREFVARICRTANTKALLVHYGLAPEVPFPGGLEDCLAAYHDLLRQGFEPANITIAGDSAGGGLVLSTLLALRDEGTALPARAIVLSLLGDLAYTGNSRQYNRRADPVLAVQRLSQLKELYLGEAHAEDRYYSPLLANFDGLPPMLGMAGSTEILLDDTVRAASQAAKANVPFNLEIWETMPHVFPFFDFLPESKVALARIAQFINGEELDPMPPQYGRTKANRRERRATLQVPKR